MLLYGLLERLAVSTGLEWSMNDVLVLAVQRGVGIEWVLKCRTQHNPLIILKHAFGTIAVVDIEIDNRDAREASGEGMGRTHRYVVEDTESHRPVLLRVVPWWTDATERRVRLAAQYQIDPLHTAPAARRAASRLSAPIAVSASSITRPVCGARRSMSSRYAGE